MIVDHYMTEYPDISRRVHDHYHRVENDDLMKNVFNTGKNKEGASNLLKGTNNVDEDAFMNDIFNSQEDPGTRIEYRSENESLEVEKSIDMVTFNDEVEEESAEDEFELKRREKGKGIEETRDTPSPTPIRYPRNHNAPLSLDKATLQELTVITKDVPYSADKEKLKELMMGGHYGLLFRHLKKTFMPRKNFNKLFAMLYEALKEMLPLMVNKEKESENLCAEITSQVNDAIANHIPLQIKFEKITTATSCRPSAIHPRDHKDHQDDDARLEGRIMRRGRKCVGTDDDDDEVPAEEVLQDLLEKMSGEIDEAQLQKDVNDMMRQQ
ncbi:hypothetical protein Tco_0492992 [Tanacetum coccineum]|uniref:Uncharacterized protein n=1 Tax=Tanacetum coccineum TaxID=301880 RepID=A0ABQ4WLZ4_9ASTR